MKIPKETLDCVLAPYTPNCRYLLEADLDKSRATGRFSIPNSFYIESTGHFNAVELVVCFNQLAYVLFAESGRLGMMREFGKVKLEEFKKYQLGSSFIVGMNNVKFRKPINPSAFLGIIELDKIITKRRDHLYFFRTHYDFGEGSATGEVDLALVK